ncbi:MAG: 50S ribosomal protein L29 [Candidatus Bathyarchaeota archaeon]|nr:50S ribosomal protein L29 [Candidatus Bathyarchaeota archaeon]
MVLLRLKDIDKMSSADRAKKLGELRAELSRIRTLISAGGAIENPSRVWVIRKTIAQLLTVENEYKLGIRSADGKAASPKKGKGSKSK